MHLDFNLSSIQKSPHLVSNNGFLLGLKLNYKPIEQLRCWGFSKLLLLLLLGRIELNIKPKTNKSWYYCYYFQPQRAWPAAAIFSIRPCSEPICKERRPSWQRQAFRRAQAGSWAQTDPASESRALTIKVCWKNCSALTPQQSASGHHYWVDNLCIIHFGSLCFATHAIDSISFFQNTGKP